VCHHEALRAFQDLWGDWKDGEKDLQLRYLAEG
jgi:hypothetical protein